MVSFLQTVIGFATAHQALLYAFAFFMAFAESVAIVGLAIPGSMAIVALGALVPSGAVAIWPLIIWSTVGAIAGDGLSYWVGYRYRWSLTGHWPFTRYPQILKRGEDFFQEHGGKGVFLGRFVAPVRGIVPLIAGIARMPIGRFLIGDVLSAIAWAPAHILPGVAVGASLALAGAVAVRLAVLLVVITAGLWLTAWVVRYLLRRGLPAIAVAQERLWRWASARDTWASRQVLSFLDPNRSEIKALALLAVLLVAAAWTFFGILEDVVAGDPLVRADTAIYHLLQGLRTAWIDRVMVAITALGDGTVTMTLTAAVFLWLAWHRAWHTAAYWVGAVAFASLINVAIKAALRVPRPVELFSGWGGFSFPSGHATVNATLYGFLAILAARAAPRWRGAIVAAAAFIVALIAFSRLYLGAHWFSDVAGGLAFATAWVSLLAIAYLRRPPERVAVAGLCAVVGSVLVLVGGAHISRQLSAELKLYAVRKETRTMDASDWWTGAWRQLPPRRVDLGGAWEEPLTFQWAGNLEVLRQRLLGAGWSVPQPWTLIGILSWLPPDPDPLKLPVLPKLQDGRVPVLMLVAPMPGRARRVSRMVLRMWASDIKLRSGESALRPLWIGSVVAERLYRPLSLFTVSSERPDVNAPRRRLAAALPTARLSRRPDQAPTRTWDGRVLLAHDGSLSLERPPAGAWRGAPTPRWPDAGALRRLAGSSTRTRAPER